MEKEMPKIYNVNCVFLGESGVGKTSIIRRLLGKNFGKTDSTIGIQVNFFQQIKFENQDENNSNININIWDTAGQEKYRACIKGVVQRADIIIFVKDNTPDNFEFWFKFVEELIDIDVKKVFYCLNKTDLISEEDMEKFMDQMEELNKEKNHHATIQCVSSKTKEGIFNLKSLLKKQSQEIISNKIQRHKFFIKILFIGPIGSGKSHMIERIINNTFSKQNLSTIAVEKKYCKVDLNDHSKINYQYYDTPGQEIFISNWINLLDNVDIIIFVNDKERIKVDTDIIKKRILLSDKKIICCISKKDLSSDAEMETILKNYKSENQELKDRPIFLVSSKANDGIKELKNKINEYAINIIQKLIDASNNNNNERISSITLGKAGNVINQLESKVRKCC